MRDGVVQKRDEQIFWDAQTEQLRRDGDFVQHIRIEELLDQQIAAGHLVQLLHGNGVGAVGEADAVKRSQ